MQSDLDSDQEFRPPIQPSEHDIKACIEQLELHNIDISGCDTSQSKQPETHTTTLDISAYIEEQFFNYLSTSKGFQQTIQLLTLIKTRAPKEPQVKTPLVSSSHSSRNNPKSHLTHTLEAFSPDSKSRSKSPLSPTQALIPEILSKTASPSSPTVPPPSSPRSPRKKKNVSHISGNVLTSGSPIRQPHPVQETKHGAGSVLSLSALDRRVVPSWRDKMEGELLSALARAYPEGINLNTQGPHPLPSSPTGRISDQTPQLPLPSANVIMSTLVMEQVIGIPGFLAWTVLPAIALRARRQLYTLRETPSQQLSEWYQPTSELIPVSVIAAFYREHIRGRDEDDRLVACLSLQDIPNRVDRGAIHLLAGTLLRLHPGLAFLADAPQFTGRYAEAVAERVFFELDPLRHGVFTARQLRSLRRTGLQMRTGLQIHRHGGRRPQTMTISGSSPFADALWEVQGEEDINRCLRYFSYEHFYVSFCRFWELDTDHDQYIGAGDLAAYDGHALSDAAVHRIMELDARTTGSDGIRPHRLDFPAFCRFLLAEEGKRSPSASRYWFDVADVDGDGFINQRDFAFFWPHVQSRLEAMGHGAPSMDDVWCQLVDMVCSGKRACCLTRADIESPPPESYRLSPSDISACGMASNLWDSMFHVSKFVQFESRDPYTVHWNTESALEKTDWDRYCRITYDELVLQDERHEPYDFECVDDYEDLDDVSAFEPSSSIDT
eukprot:gnl/Dysnectes_brevis/5194_a7363_350.p1 GENE.gnl/Dysnectes_brevis/5194_a7363_350~~gnl/Dysnectes_brevis/5194_a7363_350.p1  ORF type:complete len:721 (-),score=122.78 gnl/Dysnectes_brevis/5194_a7363_350:24-2186(-)